MLSLWSVRNERDQEVTEGLQIGGRGRAGEKGLLLVSLFLNMQIGAPNYRNRFSTKSGPHTSIFLLFFSTSMYIWQIGIPSTSKIESI